MFFVGDGVITVSHNVANCLSRWAEAGIVGCLGVADFKLTFVAVQESKHISLISVWFVSAIGLLGCM